jgi:hypothetical protein
MAQVSQGGKMSTFIKMIPLELQDVDHYFEPKFELIDGDHVVGVMSADLKKLFTLGQQYALRVEELKIKYRFSDENSEDIQAKINELSSKTDALRTLFWIAVSDEFSLWNRASTGVRRGYQVVWSDVKDTKFPPFFGLNLDDIF